MITPTAVVLAVLGAVLFSAGVLGHSPVVGAALMATGVVFAAIAAVAIPTGHAQPAPAEQVATDDAEVPA